MIAVLALSPAVDVTYDVDRLRAGEINRPLATTVVAGGKALNMARVASALDAEVHVTVALGGANGERVAARLVETPIATTVIRLAAETRSCLAIVEGLGSATSTDLYESAAPLTPAEWAGFADAVARGPASQWLAVSGSLPEGVPAEELAEVLAVRRSRGSRVAVDVAGEALVALIAVADLVKVNRQEAAEVLGRDLDDAAHACRALHERFGVDSVVTDGVHGAAALVEGRMLPVAAPRTHGRYPAGSGDAFFGGLLAGLDGSLPFAEALDLGRHAAERNARRPGQGLLAEEPAVVSRGTRARRP